MDGFIRIQISLMPGEARRFLQRSQSRKDLDQPGPKIRAGKIPVCRKIKFSATGQLAALGEENNFHRIQRPASRGLFPPRLGHSGDEGGRQFRQLFPILVFQDVLADQRASGSDRHAARTDEITRRI